MKYFLFLTYLLYFLSRKFLFIFVLPPVMHPFTFSTDIFFFYSLELDVQKLQGVLKPLKKNVLATQKYWKRCKKLLARIGKHHSIIHCSYFPCSGSVYVLNLICFKLKTWTKTCEKNIVSSIDRLNENVTIWLEHESNGLTWPEIVIVKIFIKLKPYNYNNNI